MDLARVGVPSRDPARSHYRSWQGLRQWVSVNAGGGGNGSKEQPGNGVEDIINSLKASFITEERRAQVPVCLCLPAPSSI